MTRAVALLVVTLSSSLLAGGALAQNAKTYTTREIAKFEQMQGQPQWAPNIVKTIRGTVWTFYPGGKFRYSPPNSRDDLFPLSGKYTCSGQLCHFEGEASSQIGSTGSAAVRIEGTLDLAGREPMLQMYEVTTMGNGAVINDIRFAQANASSFRFTVILKQQ